MKRRPTYAELKAQERDCKAALVSAHRSGDVEACCQLSQLKECIKRHLRRFCPRCFRPKLPIADHCYGCYHFLRFGALVLLMSGAAALAGNTNSLHLAWDHPTNAISDDLQFIVYQSSVVSAPLTNWSAAYVLTATNLSKTLSGTNWTYTATLTNSPGVYFWYATATNAWGESDPSGEVASPPPVTSGKNLRISR